MSTDQKTIDWYNKHASDYTAHVRDPKDSIYHAYYEKPAMYSLVPYLAEKIVLSLGSGSGEDSNHLKKLGAKRSVGIDIAEELVTIAKTSYPECEFYIMDMEKLDFPDESFDFVYSSLALHYIENWKQVFSEVWRILRPDSYFLFSCIHPVRSTMVETKSDENGYEKQIGISKNRGNNTFIIHGNYLQTAKIDAAIGNIMTVTSWHKSFGEILNTAIHTGFQIDRFLEPQPLSEMQDIDFQTYKRLQKIPEFMILRLKKPV